jgi:hypothetical protein
VLNPILVMGLGRSGTTAMMSFLGTIAELRIDLFNFSEQVIPGSGEVTWFRLIANTL